MTTFEIIPDTPVQALEWYKEKLDQVKTITKLFKECGYEPLESMVSLMLNYNKNIRHLEKRIQEDLTE